MQKFNLYAVSIKRTLLWQNSGYWLEKNKKIIQSTKLVRSAIALHTRWVSHGLVHRLLHRRSPKLMSPANR